MFGSLANFNAQLVNEPSPKDELVPSSLNSAIPPEVVLSCITQTFLSVSTVTSPTAPIKVEV